MISFKLIKSKLKRKLDNQFQRDDFVINAIQSIKPNALILDAGCGSQRYRKYCEHLHYYGQDFGKYSIDEKNGFASGSGGQNGYEYGHVDYVGNIWDINEKSEYFDVILCTEVLEHIPYPIDAIKEFARLLKNDGTLILTAPSNCLRHMDPYFFYTGFSDRFFEKVLLECGFEIKVLEPVGDYYSWIGVELARTAASHSFIAKILLTPAFFWYSVKRKTQESTDTLCMGYNIVAVKNNCLR